MQAEVAPDNGSRSARSGNRRQLNNLSSSAVFGNNSLATMMQTSGSVSSLRVSKCFVKPFSDQWTQVTKTQQATSIRAWATEEVS